MTDMSFTAGDARRLGAPGEALRWLLRHPPVFTALLIVAVSVVVGSINPAFWQVSNLFDILRASVVRGLFALGVLSVLAAGGIDVSFTAIAALVMYGLTKALLLWAPGLPMPAIVVLGALCGAMLGAVNGLLVDLLRAPSLIVTIGTQYVIRGFLLTFVGTALVMNIPPALDSFGRVSLLTYSTVDGALTELPAAVLVLLAAAVLTWALLNRMLMGRGIYALGGSPQIAERLGFRLRTLSVFVFAYAGLLAGVAGIMHVTLNRLANPTDLAGTELDVIAAVVLGGTRITGGSGTVLGTMLGVILITLVKNVLILVGIPSSWQLAIVGAFIILAGLLFSIKLTAASRTR